MDAKLVKRVPSYAKFNMVDMFGRPVYSTKTRYYIVDDEFGSIASVKKRFFSFNNLFESVYEDR